MNHYYSEKQYSDYKENKIKIKLKNLDMEFYSAPGIFSYKKIDLGTKVLINNCIIGDAWSVLDLGCGIGVVGIAIKLLYPETRVTMVDVNERALGICKKNVLKHHLSDVKIKKSNLYEHLDEKFHAILVNPPQSAGKDLCYQLIEKAPDFLYKKGLLQLVARKNKGGQDLSAKMKMTFGNLDVLVKEGGYWLYKSVNLS